MVSGPNSSVAGYLPPAAAPAPYEDDALLDFLHDVLAGISGIDGKQVIPGFPEDVANLPRFGTDWIGFHVHQVEQDVNASFFMDASETYEFQRHETLDILVSAYGKNALGTLSRLNDGLQIAQNREALDSVGFGLLGTSRFTNASFLVKERWTNRWDMTLSVRRMVQRAYPVLSLLSLGGSYIDNEIYKTPLIVNQPDQPAP